MRARPAVVLLTVLVAVLLATPAAAHTELRERAPAAGQTLGGDVDHIDILFWTGVETAEISLTGPDGQPIDVGPTILLRSGLLTSVEFPKLTEPGNYTVTHTELAPDGDTQTSSYGFVFDPDASGRLASLYERSSGPNWVLLGIIGGAVLVLAAVFVPRRR